MSDRRRSDIELRATDAELLAEINGETEWVCDWCNLYGDQAAAQRHRATTQPPHEIRELSPEITAAVRAERRRLSVARAAAFVAFTRANRQTGEARDDAIG